MNDLIIKDAQGIKDGLYNIQNGKLFKYKAKGGTVRTYPIVSADAIDCTDFILWLLDEIMDEENWELNAVANGEIIARKLKKLGLLEVKDGYYVRTPLADTQTKLIAQININADEVIDTALSDIERWRMWSHTYDNMCQERSKVDIPESCKKCSNHPSNGGSGICHCILGSYPIRW